MRNIEEQKKVWALGLGFAGLALIALVLNSSCGGQATLGHPTTPQPGPQADESVVRGIAVVQVNSSQRTSMMKLFDQLIPTAYAASTATTVVTYNNAASVSFVINAASLTAGSFTSNTLSLGSFSITTLKDNNLKICNPGGNTKCTQAILRVYNTGSLAGFINTTDGTYAAPVFTSGDNPATALVLNSPGVEIEQVTGMPTNKHTVQLSDFATTTFNVTSDFSNAGSGSYSMTYVVEYALAP